VKDESRSKRKFRFQLGYAESHRIFVASKIVKVTHRTRQVYSFFLS